MPPPSYSSLGGIDWNAARINWAPYLASWYSLGYGRPTFFNGGTNHVLALYFQSLGIGSGPNNVTPPGQLIPEDPDTSLTCN